MNLLIRASEGINSWVERLLAVLGISMAAVVSAQVFCRYILNHSLFWSEELARILLIWLTFLGTTSACYRNVHPGIDIVTARLPGKLQKRLRMVMLCVCSLFFLIMIWYGCHFAFFARAQISPALGLPKWLIYAAVPASGMILFLHSVVSLITESRGDTSP